MPEPKTKKTKMSVSAFLKKATSGEKLADCLVLVAIMKKATGDKGTMYGPNIVGFGAYPMVYADGHTREWPTAAFSPRKPATVIYGLRASPNYAKHLKRLGKHRVAGGCLYVKRLADVDVKVLGALITESVVARKKKHGLK